jgi:hypothetical protein
MNALLFFIALSLESPISRCFTRLFGRPFTALLKLLQLVNATVLCDDLLRLPRGFGTAIPNDLEIFDTLFQH